jgi:hypothetical protein
MDSQPDTWNQHDLDHAGGTEALQYFGCWLDFNQTDPQFPLNVPSGNDGPFTERVPIIQLVRGIHTCMVAEIRYQPGAVDPIPNGATPASSDRLSQRNLSVVESDNPGTAATHTVQHTLLIKPSKLAWNEKFAVAARPGADKNSYYDELVIRWNDIPRDRLSNVYCPDWNADEILALAAPLRPGPQRLSKVDTHTIACTVGEITYVPISTHQPTDAGLAHAAIAFNGAG